MSSESQPKVIEKDDTVGGTMLGLLGFAFLLVFLVIDSTAKQVVAVSVIVVAIASILSLRVYRRSVRIRLADTIVDSPESALRSDRIRILYLRSFIIDELMTANVVVSFDRAVTEAMLRDAVFFGLGDQNSVGIRMKRTNDETWFDDFRDAAKLADVIVMCPIATKSTMSELEYISQHFPDKTLLYMPQSEAFKPLNMLLLFPALLLRRLVFYLLPKKTVLADEFPQRLFFYKGYMKEIWNYSMGQIQLPMHKPHYTMWGGVWRMDHEGPPTTHPEFSMSREDIRRAVHSRLSAEKRENWLLPAKTAGAEMPDVKPRPLPSDAVTGGHSADAFIGSWAVSTIVVEMLNDEEVQPDTDGDLSGSGEDASTSSGAEGGGWSWFGGEGGGGDGGGPG